MSVPSSNTGPRLLFVLPGFHVVERGAEAALLGIARGMSVDHYWRVTVAGAGLPREGEPYDYIQIPCPERKRFEKWPKFPPFRNEYRWEEWFFTRRFRKVYWKEDFDITITCSFPFLHWLLRKGEFGTRPSHVFVTENGDWPPRRTKSEYKYFACEGLVCTNPEYFERHRGNYRAALIPNGIDTDRFVPGEGLREDLGIAPNVPLVLVVAALIESKHVGDAIRVAGRIPNCHLLVAGDGPLRRECDALGAEILGDRYHRRTFPAAAMPQVYNSADCLLHLSRSEAFGNIYIEALACGLAVAAHDSPLTRWILGSDGFLADGADLAAVAEQVRRALAADRSTAARNLRHRSAAERFSLSQVCIRYKSFLEEVLAEEYP